MEMKSHTTVLNEFQSAINTIDGVELISFDPEQMKLEITLFTGDMIVARPDYDGSCKAYSSVFVRSLSWASPEAAIKSIERKVKAIRKDSKLKEESSERLASRAEFEQRVMSDMTAKFGGRANCIAGIFGIHREFSLRIKLSEEQLEKFFEHNKDFIDQDGKWKNA